MILLAPGDTLASDADAGSVLTSTIFGMELDASLAEVYKVLDQRQLSATPGTIYTAPTGPDKTAFIRAITIVNTDLTAAHTFQLFKGGTAAGNAITPVMVIPAGGAANYEDGSGWSNVIILPGTTLLNDIHTGYSEYEAIANPGASPTDTLLWYARKISGRMLPKWVGPAGVDNPVQPALFGNNVVMYWPLSGSTTTGTMGITWTAAGTASHPAPSSTSPAIVNQMHRTRFANIVTTTNQVLGIIASAANLPQFWRGNAAGLGGFYFFCRFIIELYPADTVRLFVGLTSMTTAMAAVDVASDTGDFCGIAHDTADGSGVLWFITRDNTTTHKTAIPGATLAPGQAYDFYMYAKPNDSTIYYRLDDINAGVTLVDTGETNNLPRSTIFMGPQAAMSNGTANIVVTTVALGINRVYVESDH